MFGSNIIPTKSEINNLTRFKSFNKKYFNMELYNNIYIKYRKKYKILTLKFFW